MATRKEHYAAAEKWLDRAQQAWENEDGDPMLMSVVAQSAATIAQAHATLTNSEPLYADFAEYDPTSNTPEEK